ncbi:MAG: PEP/pyruvate-binding domain-containing protein, partial [Deltaproteobacteria bacterium]
ALERLVKRGFCGTIILEQWPEPHNLLRDGRARLLDILKGYKPPAKIPRQPVAAPYKVAAPEAPLKKALPEKPRRKKATAKKPEPVPPKKPGEAQFFSALVKMDRKRRSWREKLEGTLTLLADETFSPTSGNLTYLAIYLRFLGIGELNAVEDGRHYRPSHHARMAQQIVERLAAIATTQNAFIMRKIFPWLPSYESEFTRAEPLTRIRDIAHRNDIPQELKKEIKHTLQNKLHRCAGPEDLVTSTKLLQRITDGKVSYSAAFVEQFRIFHEELKEFFNAGSLEVRLVKFLDDKALAGPVKRFLAAKKDLAKHPDRQLATLSLATDLRSLLLRNAGSQVDAQSQNMRLTDIGLEDYQFVLLSDWITKIEVRRQVPWELSIRTLHLLLENLRLSGILPEESAAIAAGLQPLAAEFDPGDREQLLRLKAAIAACLRLTETYSDLVLRLFFEKAARLGRELGIDEHAVKLYSEGDIRGNLIFQLSRLAALLTRKIRQTAALSPWDVIVAGRAQGRLITANNLGEVSAAAGEKLLVLLDEAEGDETVPEEVSGIILAHGLPHLSHLAIRTRQEGVVLIAAEEGTGISQLKKQKGKSLILKAGAEAVAFAPAAGSSARRKKKKGPLSVPQVELTARQPVLELEQVSLTNGGSKAYGAQLLRTLARGADAGFTTPRGVALPFGIMEAALLKSAGTKGRYDQLVTDLAGLDGEKFLATTDELAALVMDLAVPSEVVHTVMATFPEDSRLMVRSSANSEDLESMAGAGLYESIANVRPKAVAKAIRKVWASLWTKRAALSRRQAGIPQDAVHMAILIQQMIDPDYSFVIHTVNPISGKKDELYIEMAVGLGEVLASAAVRGTPYRLVVDKKTGAVQTLAFADFSVALRPDREAGTSTALIDYSKIALTMDGEARRQLAGRLAVIGRFVEQAAGRPQDIEGAVVGEAIVLLQSRAQQGIT